MNRAMSMARLDLHTIKPYFTIKNLIIFTAVSVVMALAFESNYAVIAYIMVIGALYVSYPFGVGDKNGIDLLYVALGFNRKTVVNGRYLFAIIVDVLSAVIALMVAFVFDYAKGNEFDYNTSIITAIAYLAVYTFIQMIQIPIYFKLGYAKAKGVAFIPFICLPLVILIISNLAKNSESPFMLVEWVTNNQAISIVLLLLFWIACLFISLSVSKKHYTKRDF